MRLIRLSQQPTGISDDVRAALASIGRGANVVGGVALVGITAANSTQPVDAVVILPKGVLIITGVNLPDPAIRLHAPLHEQWTADGWPLLRTDGTVNPAVEALRLAEEVAEQLRACAQPDTDEISIGTVIAVGPYVETVEQPAAELAGTVRVLHPRATSMLAAAVSLATAKRPSTVAQARALIAALAPTAELPSEQALVAEGFSDSEQPTQRSIPDPAEHLRTVESTVPAAPPGTPPANQGEQHTAPPVMTAPPVTPAQGPTSTAAPAYPPGGNQPQPAPATVGPPANPTAQASPSPRGSKRDGTARAARSGAIRWVPMAAIGLLGCLLIAAIVLASVHSGSSSTAATAPSTTTAPPGVTVDGITFAARASASTESCAAHAFGDIKTALADSDCLRLRRASFTALIDGKRSATTVAVLGFASKKQASEFRELAATPGTGGIRDLATQTKTWPGEVPRFARAAYASSIDGATVRLVRTDWITGRSKATAPALTKVAHAALRLPLP